MKVVLCGSNGFIGTSICERLVKRSDVSLIVPTRNLCDPEYAREVTIGADVVIQAAARTTGVKDVKERPYIHTTDNAVMNSYLLRASYENSVKHFIFFSSSTIYRSSDVPVKEDAWDGNPEPCYFASAWTKMYIEKMCEFYSSLGRTKHTVLRPSNVYGPHDKFDLERSHVMGATITKILTNTDGKITIWGDGKAERDLIYVDDVVDAIEAVMEKQTKPFACYNIGTGIKTSVSDLMRGIILLSGKDIRTAYDTSKPSVDTRLALNCFKALEELGWEAKTDLETGITKTMEWWRSKYGR
jgi:GDP-L-fucose synthase